MKGTCSILAAVAACLAVPEPALGTTYLIDGPPSCIAIGGEWDGSCLVHHLIVERGDTIVVPSGVDLVTDGPAFNYGRVETLGLFQPLATFTNRGTLVTAGLTVPGYWIINSGTFVNRGWIHTHGQIDNYGLMENEASARLETCSGAVVNHSYMHNAGDLENWGTLVINNGVFVNDGTIYNPESDLYRIVNPGAFENRGSIDNGGTFSVACGGAVYGAGAFSGVPVAYERCDAASAARVLVLRVYELGRGSTALWSKRDVLALAGRLGDVAKGPPDLTAEGRIDVYDFIDAVNASQAAGRLPGHLAAALVGWAERILELPPVE